MTLEILYENGPCLAVNKPAGLLTQAPRGIDSLEWRVKDYVRKVENRGENCYLGVPHRLDRPVSGVILFGKHSRATRRLSEQFESRRIEKIYWAVVAGHVESDSGRGADQNSGRDSGTWVDYMRKIPDTSLAEIVPPIKPDAREAILHFTVLDRFLLHSVGTPPVPVTHLEIKLETGRMHQIRLQCSTHGHPILGDAAYGSDIPFGDHFDDERKREIALHSRSISFDDPMTREPVSLIAPLPERWGDVLR